jgi:EmrB/QacA subfamily drug resistance transporter
MILPASSKRWTLAVVCLATAMLMLDIAVVNTALSAIASDLHTGLSGLQWVVDAYTLALASTVLSAGFLADRFGRRRLFIGGLVLFTLASVACAASGSIETLIAARAVQGLGAAILFAVALALLGSAYREPQERAGAIAIWGATIGGSFAIGPLVGGALTTGLGWQWIFLVNVPIGLAALAIAITRVGESKDPFPRSLDYPGQILIAGAMFLLVLGLLRGHEQGWDSAPILAELGGAIALFVGFALRERTAREPMVPLKLFRNPTFAGTQLGVFAISASFFAIFLYATLYLQNVLGLSAIEAGLAYIPGTVLNFVVAGASAAFIPKLPRRVPVTLGLMMIATGMALFTLADEHSSWTAILPGELIALAGTGMVNTSLSGLALSILPERDNGLASGIHDMFRQGGIAVGVAGLGVLIPTAAGLGGDPSAFVDGLHDAFLVGAGIAVAGAVAAWALVRPAAAPAEIPAELAAATA